MQASKKLSGLKKPIILIVLLLALCGAVYATMRLIGMKEESVRQSEALNSLRETVAHTAPPEQQPVNTQAVTAPEQTRKPGWWNNYAKEPDKTIDFEALRAINEDIMAWITLPGAGIDYPVVFASKADEFYLDHDIERNISEHGTIYFDGFNSPDFSDPMMVVYGHNMKDGSMFAPLHNFESSTFWDENQNIYIYIDDYMLEYEIIAAYQTDDTHILASYDFFNAAVLEEYIKSIYEIRDMWAKFRPYELNEGDRFITLATCVEGKDDARYLVLGALIENE